MFNCTEQNQAIILHELHCSALLRLLKLLCVLSIERKIKIAMTSSVERLTWDLHDYLTLPLMYVQCRCVCFAANQQASCTLKARSFQLPRVIILIESYDELSAAADRGVGKLRLMTLGNQSSS